MSLIYTKIIDTPIGPMLAKATENAIISLDFLDDSDYQKSTDASFPEVLCRVENELTEYFAGKSDTFSVPLQLEGTEFQKRSWEYLQKIPYGTTRSYSEQAVTVGNPRAVRAVALANHYNRIAVIIPCHRVIGKNGSLTGYGAGLWRKEWLLNMEKENTKNLYRVVS